MTGYFGLLLAIVAVAIAIAMFAVAAPTGMAMSVTDGAALPIGGEVLQVSNLCQLRFVVALEYA